MCVYVTAVDGVLFEVYHSPFTCHLRLCEDQRDYSFRQTSRSTTHPDVRRENGRDIPVAVSTTFPHLHISSLNQDHTTIVPKSSLKLPSPPPPLLTPSPPCPLTGKTKASTFASRI